jgi:hypothetical protein
MHLQNKCRQTLMYMLHSKWLKNLSLPYGRSWDEQVHTSHLCL